MSLRDGQLADGGCVERLDVVARDDPRSDLVKVSERRVEDRDGRGCATDREWTAVEQQDRRAGRVLRETTA